MVDVRRQLRPAPRQTCSGHAEQERAAGDVMRAALIAGLLLAQTGALQAQAKPWSVRFADAVMQRNQLAHQEWDYTAGVILLAIDWVGVRTGDPRYAGYVKRNIDNFVQPDGTIRTYDLEEFNLDHINEGKLLFAVYEKTKD